MQENIKSVQEEEQTASFTEGGAGCMEAVSSLQGEREQVVQKSGGAAGARAGGLTTVASPLCIRDVRLYFCNRF